MAPPGCSVVLLLAVLAAASAAPPSWKVLVPPAASPVPRHPAESDLPLAQQAAAKGLTLPPRHTLGRGVKDADNVDDTATGAQRFPFGLANPFAPQRSRERKLGASDKTVRTKREADDIYDFMKLPTSIVPTRYTITIAPDLEKRSYYASTDIYVNAVEATSRVVLHAAPDLKISEVQIFKYDAPSDQFEAFGTAKIVELDPLEDLERLVIDLEKEVVPGEHYLLRFPVFFTYLREDLKGFYLSSYVDENGKTRVLGTTQFEPPAARYAFPCFDEPALKARFKIIIEHDKSLVAKSNMPELKKTNPTLTMVRTEFEETLPMSTYLLAWVVSDFKSEGDKDFTTWGRKNLISSKTASLSQTVGPRALEELKKFTGIAYSLPKVDQFAIPDFDAGAMENWGLVTYREEYLLETSATTIRIREFIATTVCHELGHQWTGNLVTLDWWSNTWLNEGFATYFENVICDKILPNWKLMDKYVTDNVHVAIANDVLPGQLAMSSPVHGTGGIEAKFDRISYKKGGSVLRMFEHVLGTEVFKKAMNRYLSVNSFKNGSPDRLFDAMDAEAQLAKTPLPAGVPFGKMAKTWTEQAGVPVVTATRNTKQGAITLTQEQFFYEKPEDHEDALWYIPIPAFVDPSTKDWTKTAPAYWLTPDAPMLADLDVNAAESQWIVVNPQQIGYYLVNYDVANWKLLQVALQDSSADFAASTRTQLVHDALALARGGRLSYQDALPFLQVLKGEREAAPWRAGIEALAFLRDKLVNTEAGEALKVFIRQITADAFKEVGFNAPEDVPDEAKDEQRYLRFYLASYACSAGNDECVAAAIKRLDDMFGSKPPPENPDVEDTALCFGVQNSDEHFDTVFSMYVEEEDLDLKGRYAAALSCTLNHAFLERILDDILSGKTSETRFSLQLFINAVLARTENHKFMLAYYKKNWQAIAQNTNGVFYFNVLTALVADIRTQAEYTEVEDFVKKAFPRETSAIRLEMQLHLEAVKKDLEWSSKYFTTVSQWLYDVTGTGPSTSTEAPATTSAPPTKATPVTRPTTASAPPGPRPHPTTAAPTPTKAPSSATHVTGALSLLLAALFTSMLR